MQQDVVVYRDYIISQPLRMIDTNSDDTDDVVNWRRFDSSNDSSSVKLSDMQGETQEDKGVVRIVVLEA